MPEQGVSGDHGDEVMVPGGISASSILSTWRNDNPQKVDPHFGLLPEIKAWYHL